jgi:proteasome lid subunit RPN8/RPN11
MDSKQVANRYKDEIRKVIVSQVNQNREAIFFIYGDGSTSKIYQGQATQISLTREQEARIMSNGNVIGSVHSHPSGFDPSTIDIITGVMTTQEAMCVAVPIYEESIDSDFVLTCLDLSELGFTETRRLSRAMRRSSVGVTETGRQLRKQISIQRFNIDGTRTHKVELDGFSFPVTSRPSKFDIDLGRHTKIKEVQGNDDFL